MVEKHLQNHIQGNEQLIYRVEEDIPEVPGKGPMCIINKEFLELNNH